MDTMSDDRVIDLGAYIRARDREDAPMPLALAGTEGERRRYVLPLWRMSYLADSRWAGLVDIGPDGEAERASIVLDQGQDPARWAPEGGIPPVPAGLPAPGIEVVGRQGLALPLSIEAVRGSWWVLLCERTKDGLPDAEMRDDLIFLAGECAGLVSLLEGA